MCKVIFYCLLQINLTRPNVSTTFGRYSLRKTIGLQHLLQNNVIPREPKCLLNSQLLSMLIAVMTLMEYPIYWRPQDWRLVGYLEKSKRQHFLHFFSRHNVSYCNGGSFTAARFIFICLLYKTRVCLKTHDESYAIVSRMKSVTINIILLF